MPDVHRVVDALGREVHLPRRPERIVSLVPSITESLFDMGVEARVVGVTRFCIHPDEARDRATVVGGTHGIDLDVLRALEPDLVIANKEENPRAELEGLIDIAPTYVTFPRTARDGIDLLRLLGTLTDTVDAAERFAGDAEAAYAAATAHAPAPPPRVLYLIWRKPWMTVNADTYVHDMLTVCGARNVAAELPQRFPKVTEAEVAALQPDAILLSTEPYAFTPEHAQTWLAQEALPAARFEQVPIVDGELCSWYGTRLGAGLRYLSTLVQNLRTAAAG